MPDIKDVNIKVSIEVDSETLEGLAEIEKAAKRLADLVAAFSAGIKVQASS